MASALLRNLGAVLANVKPFVAFGASGMAAVPLPTCRSHAPDLRERCGGASDCAGRCWNPDASWPSKQKNPARRPLCPLDPVDPLQHARPLARNADSTSAVPRTFYGHLLAMIQAA